ncbi:MAG: hypothetical protein K0U59_02850 [Gammaproteobacteria bacterium]|nr:hypothetical protein [Gammaproteobacteria bacterium]
MAVGFEVKLDVSQELQDVAAQVTATTQQLELAAQRALTKAARWLRIHSLRELGQQLGVRQTPLKKRFQVYPQHHQGAVRFWVGLQPIGVHRLGAPKVTQRGVKVGRTEYPGAFISPMKSQQALVFRREGKSRTPIALIEEDIDEQALAVIERWERRVFQRFKELFEQETGAILHGHA